MAALTPSSHPPTHTASPYEGRHAFHKPNSSLGATGHWVKTAGILAPLVIGEFVKDPDQRWRLIRIASVATALVSEGLYTHRLHRERQEAREHCSTGLSR